MRPRGIRRHPIGHDGAMRRWDGWGFEDVDAHLGGAGRSFVEAQVGEASAPAFATLADLVGAVPASRVAAHDLLDTDPEARVRHARGQSLPDLLDLRFGRLDAVPDAVARPAHRSEVRAILDLARATGTRLIPYGGGTSVVGGVNARPSPDPLVTVDLARLGRRDGDRRAGRPRDGGRRDDRAGPR